MKILRRRRIRTRERERERERERIPGVERKDYFSCASGQILLKDKGHQSKLLPERFFARLKLQCLANGAAAF